MLVAARQEALQRKCHVGPVPLLHSTSFPRSAWGRKMRRFEKNDLLENSELWQERLRKSVRELSLDWAQPLLDRLPESQVVSLQAKRASG